MLPDLALLSILIGSNYPCLELIFMVPKVFEPLKFDCIIDCAFSPCPGDKVRLWYKNTVGCVIMRHGQAVKMI